MSEKKKIASKGVSRRAVLKGTAAVAGVGAAAAVGGFPTVWANELKDITLRTLGLAVSNMDPFAKMASDALGFTVQQTAIDLGSIANRGITQPKSFDILEPAYLQMKFVWPTGNFQPVDANRLTEWNNISPLYTTGNHGATTRYREYIFNRHQERLINGTLWLGNVRIKSLDQGLHRSGAQFIFVFPIQGHQR